MRLVTSDYVLIAYIFFLVPAMLVGFGFARRKLFVPHHKLTMTTIMIVNWFLIISVMFVTYGRSVAPKIPGELGSVLIWLPALHGLLGIVAQVVATYLVIRMWFENVLPDWVKVKNIKRYMRFTLAGWLLTAVLGMGVWFVYYREFRATPVVAPSPTPVGTPAATQDANATPAKTEEAIPAATPNR
jgi:uncharacterized membrane protein YozB (DUF420 family)